MDFGLQILILSISSIDLYSYIYADVFAYKYIRKRQVKRANTSRGESQLVSLFKWNSARILRLLFDVVNFLYTASSYVDFNCWLADSNLLP